MCQRSCYVGHVTGPQYRVGGPECISVIVFRETSHRSVDVESIHLQFSESFRPWTLPFGRQGLGPHHEDIGWVNV